MTVTVTDTIGYLSTFCICITLLPQIVQMLRARNDLRRRGASERRKSSGVSLWTYLIYDVGNTAGLIYGCRISSAPVIVTSIVTLVASLLVTFLILARRGRASA